MGLPNVFNTGRTGMVAAKAAIATAGHNISNANTEGFSRQRVQTENVAYDGNAVGHSIIGSGTAISRVERVNDEYVERQIRNAGREMAGFEERDLALKQTEDVFNEMNGDGLNRLVANFFNQFRQLGNEPENEAVRQSVRESTLSMSRDFHRLRKEMEDVRSHMDAKLEGYCTEFNSLAQEVRELNQKIKQAELDGSSPNDMMDQRDVALKKLSTYADLSIRKDKDGQFSVDLLGVGPLISGPEAEKVFVERTVGDSQGKADATFSLRTTANASGDITHVIHGGKFGALLDIRDKLVSTVIDRLDELAYNVTNAVNEIHTQGYTRDGAAGVNFFKGLQGKARAAQFIDLDDNIKNSINNIATAMVQDSPGDNRVALAIASLQEAKIMNDGQATADDFFNSIVSDIGVAASKNRFNMNQQKDIVSQLGKIRDQISGVSIDEETANLMQFEHMFDASAKVIQVADELMKTVLDLKR